MEPHERIIVALDVKNLYEAAGLVLELSDHVGFFKVGLELLTNEGAPHVVGRLKEHGVKVFYDGKFMDIPNTVAGASRAVAKLGVDMFNVHASGGAEMMEAAVANKGNCKVLAVTILTSLSNTSTVFIYGVPALDKVMYLAGLAYNSGVDGIICSPKELMSVRKKFPGILLVTPGVRPTWAAKGDQARVMTPGEAVKAGADYLVIGRPITQPPEEIGSPVEAAKLIAEEIGEALQ